MLNTILMLMGKGADSDPYFSSVSLLLHMNGTDGSTTFTDQKGHTFSVAGDAQIDTAQSKFDGASALFDGTGDYIYTTDSTDFTIGAGDATIEMFLRTSTATHRPYGQCDNAASISSLSVIGFLNVGKFIAYAGVGATLKSVTSTTSINDSNWHHIAQVISGGTMYLYIDGVSEGTPIALGGNVNDSSNNFSIGANGEYNSAPFNGWIDEFRFTKGVARYTSNFTPPTAPFPNN